MRNARRNSGTVSRLSSAAATAFPLDAVARSVLDFLIKGGVGDATMGAPGERERDIVEVLAAEAGAARHGGDNGIAVVSEADLRVAMGHISQTAAMLEKESEA